MKIFKNISICGLGLIGSSLGMCIRERNLADYVVGIVRRKEMIKKCEKMGVVDFATESLSEGVRDADLFIVCTPVGSIVEVIRNSLPYLKEGCLITDVGSTKKEIVFKTEKILKKDIYFIGGHPITGSEKSGMEFANSSIFENSYYILTPYKKYRKNLLLKLKKFIRCLGAKPVIISPSEHDFFLSFTSHLPHILAFCLVNTLDRKKNWEKFIGNSFRDFTRVAGSSPVIWQDIFLTNRKELLKAIEKFKKNLEIFEFYLKENNKEEIYKFLDFARIKKEKIGR